MIHSGPFDAYSNYYDLLYRDKDYISEVDYIDKLLQSHFITGSKILEFGSGTGKHGVLLAERGYRVRGIERSAEMVSKAKHTSGFFSEQGDICTVQLGSKFDAVISLFHVISYQVKNESVRAVFARASDHLMPGGLFVFDVWYTPAVYKQRPSVRVKRLEGEGIRIVRIAEPILYPNDNYVDVDYTIIAEKVDSGDVDILSERHSMRHFSLPELRLFAELSGFEMLAAESYLTGEQPSDTSWGLCVTLRKL